MFYEQQMLSAKIRKGYQFSCADFNTLLHKYGRKTLLAAGLRPFDSVVLCMEIISKGLDVLSTPCLLIQHHPLPPAVWKLLECWALFMKI